MDRSTREALGKCLDKGYEPQPLSDEFAYLLGKLDGVIELAAKLEEIARDAH